MSTIEELRAAGFRIVNGEIDEGVPRLREVAEFLASSLNALASRQLPASMVSTLRAKEAQGVLLGLAKEWLSHSVESYRTELSRKHAVCDELAWQYAYQRRWRLTWKDGKWAAREIEWDPPP